MYNLGIPLVDRLEKLLAGAMQKIQPRLPCPVLLRQDLLDHLSTVGLALSIVSREAKYASDE